MSSLRTVEHGVSLLETWSIPLVMPTMVKVRGKAIHYSYSETVLWRMNLTSLNVVVPTPQAVRKPWMFLGPRFTIRSKDLMVLHIGGGRRSYL